MKSININDLFNEVAAKVGLSFKSKNFEDFSTFVEKIYTEFDTSFSDIYEQMSTHEVSYPDRTVTMRSDILREVFEDADEALNIRGEEVLFYDTLNEECDVVTKMHDVEGPLTTFFSVSYDAAPIDVALKYWQNVCKQYGGEIELALGENNTREMGGYSEHSLKWHITADKIESMNSYINIDATNADELLGEIYLFVQNFLGINTDTFDTLGIDVRYEDNAIETRADNGKAICLAVEHNGESKKYFSDYATTKALVEQYPIVYTCIPDEFNDEEMAKTFIDANSREIAQYEEIVKISGLNSKEYRRQKGREYAIRANNALLDELVDFRAMTSNINVIRYALEHDTREDVSPRSLGRFALNNTNFKEKLWTRLMKRMPILVMRVFDYYLCNITAFPKVVEHVRTKYELYNVPHTEILALFKTLEMLDKDCAEGIKWLLMAFGTHFYHLPSDDYVQYMHAIFDMLDSKTKEELVEHNCYFAKYLRRKEITEEMASKIVSKCPIAADVLRDEDVIKYNLEKDYSLEDIENKCRDCDVCLFSKIHWNQE